jgi:citrate synthase
MTMTSGMPLRDVMSAPVVTGSPDESLHELSRRMDEHHIGAVVLLDGNEVAGILTERDMVRAGGADANLSAPASQWMTATPRTLPPDATWDDAAELIRESDFRHVPIVENAQLIGVVSLRDLMKTVYLSVQQPPAKDEPYEAPPGLANVAVAQTKVSDVLGREGYYHYRGYNAVEIASRGHVEDAWHLMHEGDLPTPEQRRTFVARTRSVRRLPEEVWAILPDIATRSERGSLQALRTAVAYAGQVQGFRPWGDHKAEEIKDQALTLSAQVPVLATALFRLASGQEVIRPRDDLGYAADFMHMLTGEVPSDEALLGVERYLMLTIDHGFNASTFTARVIASSGADLGSVVAGAIGTLSGPLHGGAPARVFDMLDEIGTPENAEPWLRNAIETGVKLMGFGHRVYKTIDPRSKLLHEMAAGLGGERVRFSEVVEETAVRLLEELKPGRELYANVEFYAGVVLEAAGLPREMFSATFASSRTIGWMANVVEQTEGNRIFRPLAHYVGPKAPRDLPPSWDPSAT